MRYIHAKNDGQEARNKKRHAVTSDLGAYILGGTFPLSFDNPTQQSKDKIHLQRRRQACQFKPGHKYTMYHYVRAFPITTSWEKGTCMQYMWSVGHTWSYTSL